MEMPASWSEVRPLLLPKVRERYFLSFAEGPPRLFRPLGRDLAVGLVLDHPKLVVYLTEPMLADWGLSADEVFEAATENLLRRTPGKPFEQLAPGLYRSPWQDGYDATRLLFIPLMASLSLAGSPVAVPLTRNALLVAGSDDPVGLASMFQAVRQGLSREELLTPVPLRLDAGEWSAYAPADASWLDVIVSHEAELYREQSLDLARHHAENKVKTHVALLLPVRSADRLLFTLTHWPSEGEALLPVANHVTLGTVGDPRLRAYAFEDALRHFGHYLREEPGFPRRYRSAGFPTAEELEAAPSTPLASLVSG